MSLGKRSKDEPEYSRLLTAIDAHGESDDGTDSDGSAEELPPPSSFAKSLPPDSHFGRGKWNSTGQKEPPHPKKRRSRKKKKPKRPAEIVDEDDGVLDMRNTAALIQHRRSIAGQAPAMFVSPSSTPVSLPPSMTSQGPPSMRSSSADIPESASEGVHCFVAKSALILPFRWSNPMKADLQDWVQHSTNRTIVGPDGGKMRLWRLKEKLPYEATDLDPHFRELIGAQHYFDDEADDDDFAVFYNATLRRSFINSAVPDSSSSEPTTESNTADEIGSDTASTGEPTLENTEDPLDENCMRLELNPHVLSTFFAKARLCATAGGFNETTTVQCPVLMENVEMVVFPLGTAILMFHVNWLYEPNTRLTLEEFRAWLHLSKYQYKVPGVHEGWLFRGDSTSVDRAKVINAHAKSLGSKLSDAIYGTSPVSLSALGNWLVSGEGEDSDAPPNRLGRYLKRCYHHTCVVIDKQPSKEEIQEYLFHLRRAQGQDTMPSISESGVDVTLMLRPNRYIGISRSGTACLSWPTTHAEFEFEVGKWPSKFLGVFLILSMHVYGEKSVLLELSNLSSDAAKLLKGIQTTSLTHMYNSRMALIALATLISRYTLQMSSDDCGGLPEYVEFFGALRKMFGIRKQRAELREEIQDVLALIETNYNEEQQKMRNLEKQERLEAEARRRKIEIQNEQYKARYERFVAIVSSFTIPLVLISGIWGMNLDDLPQYPFWPLIGATTLASLVLLVILVCVFRRPPAAKQLMIEDLHRSRAAAERRGQESTSIPLVRARRKSTEGLPLVSPAGKHELRQRNTALMRETIAMSESRIPRSASASRLFSINESEDPPRRPSKIVFGGEGHFSFDNQV